MELMAIVKSSIFYFVFGLPLLVVPGWHYGFELPKVLALMTFAFTGLVFLLGVNNWKRVWQPLTALVFLWWMSLVLASVWGVGIDKMVWGGVNRWQGGAFYLSLIFVYLQLNIFLNRGDVGRMGRVLMASALVMVAVGGIQKLAYSFGVPVPMYADRVVASMGQANFFADFLVLSWIWWAWMNPIGKKISKIRAQSLLTGHVPLARGFGHLFAFIFSNQKFWIVTAAIFVGLFLAGSRLGLAVFGVLLVIMVGKRWMGVISALFVILVYSLIGFALRFGGFGERVVIWNAVWEKIGQRWWQGYGLENMGQVLGGVNVGGESNWYVDRAHNVFLDMAFVAGVPGLVLFVAIVVFAFWKAWRAKNTLGIVMLLTWLVLSSIHVVGVVGWLMWVLILWLIGSSGDKINLIRIEWWKLGLAAIYAMGIIYLLWMRFAVWVG